MDDLTPPILRAVRDIKWQIQSGHSVREALRIYFEQTHSAFAHQLQEWWTLRNQGTRLQVDRTKKVSAYYRAFIELLERGLSGQPVLTHLRSLEAEIYSAAQSELESHLAQLPFKVLIPLLLFLFPAFLILLLGPLLRELTLQLGQ